MNSGQAYSLSAHSPTRGTRADPLCVGYVSNERAFSLIISLTTTALVNELLEAKGEKRLLRYQKQIASYELLIVDELGFVSLSKSGAELLFEVFSQRYERGPTLVT